MAEWRRGSGLWNSNNAPYAPHLALRYGPHRWGSGDAMEKRSFEAFQIKVVEHILLLKAKSDLLEDEEKNMLDYLFTTQYQMSGTLALSLGRIEDQNADGFSHAVFMRFQRKEDLAKYYKNSYYSGVLKEHVMPHCYDFNYGVEFMLLISVAENAHEDAVNDALVTLHNLIIKFDSLIIQATQGTNLNLTDTEYTHGAVIRFPSRVFE
ncbi:hypothetical protein QJS10_CPB18g01506 [Acorus calamus]|uniref:Stress-response A/B barrel domain-containing protein n=1 Tax=Acorus calamus TaxID=4465 RepID=A0AAV9CMD5_ACOCL|nr:hypothetical protein QJS10_CPB18g01506 [Acorus calamus]